jgi:hypothetical protein
VAWTTQFDQGQRVRRARRAAELVAGPLDEIDGRMHAPAFLIAVPSLTVVAVFMLADRDPCRRGTPALRLPRMPYGLVRSLLP